MTLARKKEKRAVSPLLTDVRSNSSSSSLLLLLLILFLLLKIN